MTFKINDMQVLYRIIAILILTLAPLAAPIASTAATIGLSIPLSGDFAELGRSFRTGANIAMELHGSGHELFIADDGCDTDLAKLAASDLKSRDPVIVTGFLCNEPAIISANQLRESKTPLLVAGARSVRLIKDRKREAWNLWRMSPGDDYGYKAAAKAIEKRWKDIPYAVVDDGTIFGRNYTDGLRLVLNEGGVKPQISDNFRAAQSTQAGLWRRLQRSGVQAAFIAAATVEDLVTIAKNKQELDIKIDLVTSGQLAVLPYLDEASSIPAGIGVIKQAVPENTQRLEFDRLLRSRGILPNQQVYDGYAAIQVALEVISNGEEQILPRLKTRLFETVIGKVKFSDTGANIINPYKMHIWDGVDLVLPATANAPIQ